MGAHVRIRLEQYDGTIIQYCVVCSRHNKFHTRKHRNAVLRLLRHTACTCTSPNPPLSTPARQEWEALQQSIQRRERALLETKSKVTHPVYSLYFPEEKQEWWWLYIADRRDQTLVSMPYHVCTLKDTEEVSLRVFS